MTRAQAIQWKGMLGYLFDTGRIHKLSDTASRVILVMGTGAATPRRIADGLGVTVEAIELALDEIQEAVRAR
jgi:hypothetical protein